MALFGTTMSNHFSCAGQKRNECRTVHPMLVFSAPAASAVKRNLVVVVGSVLFFVPLFFVLQRLKIELRRYTL
jgi:hypothetical protein